MSDLISRQAAIDAIYEHEFSNWCDKDEVSTILNDLPSAEPKVESATIHKEGITFSYRKTGKWIITENCSNELGVYRWYGLECPCCGFKPCFETIEDMKFCPNCGARLRGEKE